MVVEVEKEVTEEELWKRVREIGDSIHNSIQLEADYPSRYPDQKVPILDIKVWVDTEGRVMHEYYSKAVSSKSVIDEKSAMPFKDRRTVLTQDLLRVILRCSPDLPWSEKKKHIEEYVLRMQFSGYCEKVRKEVEEIILNLFRHSKPERGGNILDQGFISLDAQDSIGSTSQNHVSRLLPPHSQVTH